ncbi:hypothetical protein AVEN_155159-1 [Araneus ventricosus]|uniref:Uncharacterized protein n=1 Tax=Araneus ventricosus TaxID=182803 RepID=A0A4Y2S8L6_ARAVE|nr:hypothetical protein AVEN_155159-1 [Araneus ventricosus]
MRTNGHSWYSHPTSFLQIPCLSYESSLMQQLLIPSHRKARRTQEPGIIIVPGNDPEFFGRASKGRHLFIEFRMRGTIQENQEADA